MRCQQYKQEDGAPIVTFGCDPVSACAAVRFFPSKFKQARQASRHHGPGAINPVASVGIGSSLFYNPAPHAATSPPQCPGGEIGRRKGLKIPRSKGRTGSIPVPGTSKFNKM